MALVTCNFTTPSPSSGGSDLRRWNQIIRNQVLKGNVELAIHSYIDMQKLGFSADNYTFPLLLKAAGNASSLRIGLTLHGQTVKTGFCYHLFVQTALLKLYSSLGLLVNARKVFDKMPVRDAVAWNSMLYVYTSCGQMDNAMEIFDTMPSRDLSSFNIMISGFAGTRSITSARSIFDRIPEKDVVSWNSMILACMNAGETAEARTLFEAMPERNVITWNTMVMGYVNNQLYTKAIDLFYRMKAGDIKPDYLTLTGTLSACSHLGSLETGVNIHIYAKKLEQASSPHVVTALIDMYAKCGSIHNSLAVFYKSKTKDIYCWNALISGLALHGFGHAGLVKEGCEMFDSMKRDFGITPKAEHYGCVVDLLSRAEHFDSAFQLIERMPFEPGESVLGALLSACVIHQDLEAGEKAMELVVKRDWCLSGGEYMMFSNLYASCGQWEEAERWRNMMNDSGIVKTAGCSEIQVNGRFHKFLAGELGVE